MPLFRSVVCAILFVVAGSVRERELDYATVCVFASVPYSVLTFEFNVKFFLITNEYLYWRYSIHVGTV